MSLASTQPASLEAQLLLHAVGELPPAEADALERAIASDEALAEKFQAIRADVARTQHAFGATEHVAHVSETRVVTRAVEAIRRWQLGQPVESGEARLVDPPEQHWGWATRIAALIAVGLGIAAIVAYVDSTRPARQQATSQTEEPSELPTDGQENALAIHAATSLAIGLDLDEETLPINPMPHVAEVDSVAMNGDEWFFNVPLVAEPEDQPR